MKTEDVQEELEEHGEAKFRKTKKVGPLNPKREKARAAYVSTV